MHLRYAQWDGRTNTIYTNTYPGGVALIDLVSATNVTTRPRIATKDIVSSTRVIRSVVSSIDMFNCIHGGHVGWAWESYRIPRYLYPPQTRLPSSLDPYNRTILDLQLSISIVFSLVFVLSGSSRAVTAPGA